MHGYTFDWSVIWRAPYGRMLLDGALTTVQVSLLAWCLAVLVGLLVGIGRVSPRRLPWVLSLGYVQVFRNIPLLLQLFFWYFAAPMLLPEAARDRLNALGADLAWAVAVLGLGLYTASRVAEQVRAGIQAIPAEVCEAALGSGLTAAQAYRHVILPCALRLVIPTLTAEFLTCFKNSALAMTIGVLEVTGAAYQIDSYTYHGLETMTAASAVYLFISASIAWGMSRVESRGRIRGLVARRG